MRSVSVSAVPSPSMCCHAGSFSSATSPAGKASRHLSGCGSQPELPQHIFSSFAAGKPSIPRPPSRLATSRASPPLSEAACTHQPALTASPEIPSPEEQVLLASTAPTALDEGSGSPDISASAQCSLEIGSPSGAASVAADNRTGMDMSGQAAGGRAVPCGTSPVHEAALPAAGSASAVGLVPVGLPASRHVLPASAASRGAIHEPASGRGQAGKRKVSAFFGGQHKRLRNAEAEELPVPASPYGLLGGLVSKLTPQPPRDDCDISADDSISVDLDADVEREGVAVARDNASEAAEQEDVEPHTEAIAGLEHVRPFASIANVAVGKVKAASLNKFGMAGLQKPTTRQHVRSVLQPFAPPRRWNASQDGQHAAGCTQGGSLVAPALQNFACLVASNDKSRTRHQPVLSNQ